MKKIWIHKAKSFKEAEIFEDSYYSSMSIAEKLNCMQYLREIYYNFGVIGRKARNASRKGLQRIIRVIQ